MSQKHKESKEQPEKEGFFSRKIYPLLEVATRTELENSLRQIWARGPEKANYKKAVLLTVTTTNKCSLKCGHCFEEAGPEGRDFLDTGRVERLAEESVDLLKDYDDNSIRITGGDPILHLDIFRIVNAFSKRLKELKCSELDVETNGWWATDNIKTRDIVMGLKDSGATLLSMTVDYWHRKQRKFPNYEHFERIDKVAKIVGLNFRMISVGMPSAATDKDDKEDGLFIPEVTPIGRGRSLPEEYWGYHLTCRAAGCRLIPPTQAIVVGPRLQHDEITIGPNGNVYACNSGKAFKDASLAIGNIYDNSLPDIVKKQDNFILKILREKGLRALTAAKGLSLRQHWEMYDKFSPCGLCHEMLRNHGKEITKRLKGDYSSIQKILSKEKLATRLATHAIMMFGKKRVLDRIPKIFSGGSPF